MKRIHRFGSIAVALAFVLSLSPAFAQGAPHGSRAQYFDVKAAMQRMYDVDSAKRAPNGKMLYFGDDLIHCRKGSEYTGAGEKLDTTAAFADVALDVIQWRETFRRLGYPAGVWQQPLAAYERKAVARAMAAPAEEEALADAFAHETARRLNAYRSAHPGLPEIEASGGCGAGEGTVSIATIPIGGIVMFIPTFFYELCKVQNQNADDPRSCPRWREAIEGKLQSVAGDYMYFVRWHDGTVRRGKLSFDMGDDGKTITLRKP